MAKAESNRSTQADRAGADAGADAASRGLAQMDPLLQHRCRLGACVLLSGGASMTFARLKELLDETDGNLGANLRKLEDAGYLTVRKEFVDRKPTSWYALTPQGARSLRGHLGALETIIRSAKQNGG
jgi:DNA-binding transcriptional ArsR family regulator